MNLRGLLAAEVRAMILVAGLGIELRIINRVNESSLILLELGLESGLNLEIELILRILIAFCESLKFFKCRQVLRFFYTNLVFEAFDRRYRNIQ